MGKRPEEKAEPTVALMSCYQEEFAHYRHLMDTAREIQEEIRAGNMDKVCRILEDQAEEIALIDELERKALPLKEKVAAWYGVPEFSLAAFRQLPGDENLKELLELAERIYNLLQKLAEVEEVNQRLLQEKMNELRKETEHLQKGEEATNAYLVKPYRDSEPRFIDRKGL